MPRGARPVHHHEDPGQLIAGQVPWEEEVAAEVLTVAGMVIIQSRLVKGELLPGSHSGQPLSGAKSNGAVSPPWQAWGP